MSSETLLVLGDLMSIYRRSNLTKSSYPEIGIRGPVLIFRDPIHDVLSRNVDNFTRMQKLNLTDYLQSAVLVAKAT
jgi:hypothetical protein